MQYCSKVAMEILVLYLELRSIVVISQYKMRISSRAVECSRQIPSVLYKQLSEKIIRCIFCIKFGSNTTTM